MSFVWFWTFWHWGRESFRAGALLRSPLHGIGGHWDEWFRHEASESDLQAIAEAGRNESNQRQFIAWLCRRWARESGWSGNRMVARFVLGQLAHLPPFNQWPAFEKYRTSYGAPGISAIVLSAESQGEAEDVRGVEALALPAENAPGIVSEGFHSDAAELETPRRAALSLISGKSLLQFLTLWIVGGERSYPRWLRLTLGLGWLAVGGLILFLLLGPEPGEHLVQASAALVILWSGLLLSAGITAGLECVRAWRQGRHWKTQLERSQVRLRMDGGLTLKGGSAGLSFCLNTLLALQDAAPRATRRSWLWQRFFRRLRVEARSWAATGFVTADGTIQPVVLAPKLRACLRQPCLKHLLTPMQADAPSPFVSAINATVATAEAQGTPAVSPLTQARLGFAAEERRLTNHPCRNLAQVVMAIGGFDNRWQKAVTGLALVSSCAMLFALPDLRGILLPPAPPQVVAPSSPSPYHLWVSLDTKHFEDFQVVLESNHWANRKAKVARCSGANASVRAEILLHRLAGQPAGDGEDGTVWVERRRHFLGRDYAPGERVGRYSISYLNRIAHE